MRSSEFTFNSCTAKIKFSRRLYEPDTPPAAVLQISHGMAGTVRFTGRSANIWRSAASPSRSTTISATGAAASPPARCRPFRRPRRPLQRRGGRAQPPVCYAGKIPRSAVFSDGAQHGLVHRPRICGGVRHLAYGGGFHGHERRHPEGVWRAEHAYLEMLKKVEGAAGKAPAPRAARDRAVQQEVQAEPHGI